MNSSEILKLYSKALVGNIKKINSQTVEQPDSFYIDKYLRLYIKDCKGNYDDWINSVCKRLEIKTCLSNIPQNKKFKI